MIEIVVAICACVVCTCGASMFDEDLLEHRLSMSFSEMYRTNGNEIALRIMARPSGMYVRELGSLAGLPRLVQGEETILLKPGDRMRLGIPNSMSRLEVAAVSEIGRMMPNTGQGDFGKSIGLFLVFHRQMRSDQRTESGGDRSFAIDFNGGTFYDVEKKLFGTIKLPFCSSWKNWDDYMENFIGLTNTCELVGFRDYAIRTRNSLMADNTLLGRRFRDCCRKAITNDTPEVMRYHPGVYAGNFAEFHMAYVRMRRETIEVLGLASFHPDNTGLADMVYMFDEDGHLHWVCCFWKTINGKSKNVQQGSIYEFGQRGDLRHFVELDGNGRELPRNRRFLKDMEMVPHQGRAAFFSDMYKAIAPMIEKFEKRSFVEVSALPVTHRRQNTEVVARMEEQKRKESEMVIAANQKRLRGGMPNMTDVEERMFLRNEWLKTSRIWFERMRQETSGRSETSAQDAMVDLERARLFNLYNMVKHIYPVVTCRSGTVPKTLHEVAVCREPGSGKPLLPGGENDLKDQWGHEYRYRVGQGEKIKMATEHPIITSAGPDGVFGTEDDLSSEDWFVFRKIEAERRRAQPGMSSNR